MLCSTHCEFGNEARNDAKPVDCSVDFRKCKLDETSNEMTVHTVGLPLRKVSCSSTRMRSCSPVKEHVVFMSVSPLPPFHALEGGRLALSLRLGPLVSMFLGFCAQK